MKMQLPRRIALLALLLALSACGRRPIGPDAATDGAGQLDTGAEMGPGGLDARDGAGQADTPADGRIDTPEDATGDGRHDVAPDVTPDVTPDLASDVTTDVDAPSDGGPAAEGPADRSGGDVPCGAPTDPRNCGTCDHDCTALPHVRADRVACRDGACIIPVNGCLPGYGNCSGDTERGCESDVSQPVRCGCGVNCPPSSTRLCATPPDGTPMCVATCAEVAGLIACGQQCVDLKTNSAHCGACNARCQPPNAEGMCVAGQCAVSRCLKGHADCNPAVFGCETIVGSFYECRSCGDTCATAYANGACAASGCTRTCHAGFGDCNATSRDCETPLDTAANCGSCGTVCPNDRPLCGGQRGHENCLGACAAPTPDACGSSCTDLQSDPRHCGACGTVCESYQACDRGRCTPRYVKTDVQAVEEADGVQGGSPLIAPDGSYFVSGTFWKAVDFNPSSGQDIRTPSTLFDTYLSKFEADGSYAWTRTWTGASVAASTVLADGSVIATGSFSGTIDFNPGANVARLTAQGEADALVMKLTPSGGLVWARAFTMTTEDAASSSSRGAKLGTDGSIYVVGTFRGQIDLDPGSATDGHRTADNNAFDAYVVKLTATGNFVWGRALGGPMEDDAATIAVDASGLLWIGGSFSGTADLDPGTGVEAHTAASLTDGFVVRLDANGNFRDSRIYALGDYASVDSISFDSDGSVYVGGAIHPRSTTSPDTIGFIQKLSPAGNEVWLQRKDGMFSAQAAPGGGVLFAGGGRTSEPGVPILLVVKLDRDGNSVWGIPSPVYRGYFSFAFAADATKIVISGTSDGGSIDLDPGVGRDVVTAPGATITRFAF